MKRGGGAGKLRRGEERKREIEEKQLSLVASVNVLHQVMKTKEDVYQALKTKEEVYRTMKTRERKNYFDHLAFMSRLTGK